jgi:hypothetical protein
LPRITVIPALPFASVVSEILDAGVDTAVAATSASLSIAVNVTV